MGKIILVILSLGVILWVLKSIAKRNTKSDIDKSEN